jgi:O-antigen/teichoic acid export membrane protein
MFGQDRAVLRYYPNSENPQAFLSSLVSLWMTLVLPIVFGILLMVSLFPNSSPFGIPTRPHIALLVFLLVGVGAFRIVLALMRAEEKVYRYVSYEACYSVLKVAAVLGFAMWLHESAVYLYGALCAAGIVAMVQLPDLVSRIRWDPSKREMSKLWTFGWPLVFHAVSGTLLASVDRFMLEVMQGAAEVGVYGLAYTFGAGTTFVFSALAMYFEPLVYRHAENEEKTEHWLGVYTLLCFGVVGITGVVIVVALPYVILPLYGAEYESTLVITPVIVAGHALLPLYLQSNYRLTVYNQTKRLAIASAAALLVNVVVNVLLIPELGGYGAAIATVVGHAVLAFYAFRESIKTSGVKVANTYGFATVLFAIAASAVTLGTSSPIWQAVAFGAITISAAVQFRKLRPIKTFSE